MMEAKKKLRCPLGVPGGIIAALIGVGGIICSAIYSNWPMFAISLALFLISGPFVRITMMVHSANDRLDELESKINK
jgi:uncharacterized membrane protein YtjA (UPF0391 family)